MMQKKQRLMTEPQVEGMLAELEQASAERSRSLVLDILRAQLAQLLRKRDEPDTEPAPPADTSAEGPGPGTMVSDLIDSRLATELKGWIFRHLAADVHTQDVLESSVEQLASHVIAARGQPLGAQI